MRRRLQQSLARYTADDAAWSVSWAKAEGEWLRPNDVAVRLRCEDIVVELAYAYRAKLAELAVPAGRVACGATLARLERRAKPAGAQQAQLLGAVGQFALRQRLDAERIAVLEHDLSANQQLVDRLRSEIAVLRVDRDAPPSVLPDPKFKRLKTEFSKRFHPDAGVLSDSERLHRQRVFQEFWPIVEKIERS